MDICKVVQALENIISMSYIEKMDAYYQCNIFYTCQEIIFFGVAEHFATQLGSNATQYIMLV